MLQRFVWPIIILLIIFVALVRAGILFPVASEGGRSKKEQTIGDEISLVRALRNYYTDYGLFPAMRADGRYETTTDNAKLIKALLGLDATDNTRRVVYFEAKAFDSHSLRSGLDAQGAFLDPWGNPYRIRVDADYDDKIENPYREQTFIYQGVIVWSVGKDGVQGSTNAEDKLAGSDDVASWQP